MLWYLVRKICKFDKPKQKNLVSQMRNWYSQANLASFISLFLNNRLTWVQALGPA